MITKHVIFDKRNMQAMIIPTNYPDCKATFDLFINKIDFAIGKAHYDEAGLFMGTTPADIVGLPKKLD